MNLVPAFMQRRVWILSHGWLSELALSLILPVILYVAVVVSLGGLVTVPPEAKSFPVWAAPGIIFTVVLASAYFPLFVDLFQNRTLLPFLESVAGSPNSSLSIVTAVLTSLLPDVIVKGLVAAVIVQLLAGTMFPLVPFLGFLVFSAILGFLILNLSLSLSLLTRRPFSHLFTAFVLLLFVILSSGWIIPQTVFPSAVVPFFAALPTSLLAQGARDLIFRQEITFVSWLVPLAIGLVWTLVNGVIFARVNIR